MAQRIVENDAQDTDRCRKCRFWFERCCHALALLQGDDKAPCNCVHFVVETAPPHRMMEAWP